MIYSSIIFRICPRHPRKTSALSCMGNLSAVRQRTEIHRNLTSPWFSPSRPKAEVSLFCDGSLLWEKLSTHLPSTYRSFPQWEIIAFVTDVAHHHRNVTEECVLNFQRSLAYSITAQIVKCVGLVGLLSEPDRSTFGNIFHFLTHGHEKRPGIAGLC